MLETHLIGAMGFIRRHAGFLPRDDSEALAQALNPYGPLTQAASGREELRHQRAESNMELRWRVAIQAETIEQRAALAKCALHRGWAVKDRIYGPDDTQQLISDGAGGEFECILWYREGWPSITPVPAALNFQGLLPYKSNFRRAGLKGGVRGGYETIRRVARSRIEAYGPQDIDDIAEALFVEGLAEGSYISIQNLVRYALRGADGLARVYETGKYIYLTRT
jgi:hypothetical protein